MGCTFLCLLNGEFCLAVNKFRIYAYGGVQLEKTNKKRNKKGFYTPDQHVYAASDAWTRQFIQYTSPCARNDVESDYVLFKQWFMERIY